MISQDEGKELKNLLKSTTHNTINNNFSKLVTGNKTKKEISFVKILNIRENEHFGDVLMFLGQRSPLRVRVRSKKSELFFLKKIDAIGMSSSFPNIWRRINKKSIYNFNQIKRSIIKIVRLYCSFKNQREIKKFTYKKPKQRKRRRI